MQYIDNLDKSTKEEDDSFEAEDGEITILHDSHEHLPEKELEETGEVEPMAGHNTETDFNPLNGTLEDPLETDNNKDVGAGTEQIAYIKNDQVVSNQIENDFESAEDDHHSVNTDTNEGEAIEACEDAVEKDAPAEEKETTKDPKEEDPTERESGKHPREEDKENVDKNFVMKKVEIGLKNILNKSAMDAKQQVANSNVENELTKGQSKSKRSARIHGKSEEVESSLNVKRCDVRIVKIKETVIESNEPESQKTELLTSESQKKESLTTRIHGNGLPELISQEQPESHEIEACQPKSDSNESMTIATVSKDKEDNEDTEHNLSSDVQNQSCEEKSSKILPADDSTLQGAKQESSEPSWCSKVASLFIQEQGENSKDNTSYEDLEMVVEMETESEEENQRSETETEIIFKKASAPQNVKTEETSVDTDNDTVSLYSTDDESYNPSASSTEEELPDPEKTGRKITRKINRMPGKKISSKISGLKSNSNTTSDDEIQLKRSTVVIGRSKDKEAKIGPEAVTTSGEPAVNGVYRDLGRVYSNNLKYVSRTFCRICRQGKHII